MDATAILPKPAPTAPKNAPGAEQDTSPEEFASHLPPEEDVRPAPRKPDTRKPATESDAKTLETTDEAIATKPDDATSESCAAMTTPAAPVEVRPQNSVVTFDLSAMLAAQTQASPAVAAPKAEAGAQTKTAPVGAPVAPATEAPANAQQQPVADAAQAPAATDQTAAPQQQRTPLETIALPGAQAQSETKPAPKLRAGRTDAASEIATDGKTPAAAQGAPAAAAAAKGAAKVETAAAVQAVAGSAATKDTASNADVAPLSDAAPAEQRAHRVNDAAGPQGHRATTPAALVAQHIIRRFDGKSTSIDVRLDPAELGRVQVSLEVSADNKVTAVVAAENPQTLSDLVRSARELERALQDAGLDLDSGGLSFDLADSGKNAKGEDGASNGRSASARTDATRDAAPVQSRPFGLEAWRGARIDVMV